MNSSSRYLIRELSVSDYDLNYLGLLGQLTHIGDVSKEDFIAQYQTITRHKLCYVLVMIDLWNGQLVGTGAIFFEPKFIHGCSYVGHIEDIVIDKEYRSQHLGYQLINKLLEYCEQPEHKCYKVILDCDTRVIPFYEKFGFSLKENHMAKYLARDK